MQDLTPGRVLRFHHLDARNTPKEKRPGIVETTRAGRYAVFYGSTFKRNREPDGSVVADPMPTAKPEELDLAKSLGKPISERTWFHGSMVTEVELSALNTIIDPDGRCPNDILDILEEQGEEQLLAFYEAWSRTAWVQPSVRAGLLYQLWWGDGFSIRDRLALSLLLCDGWNLSEVSSLRKADVTLPGGIVICSGVVRRLLPHTLQLFQQWAAGSNHTLEFVDSGSELAVTWEELRSRLSRNQQKACIKWDDLRQKIRGTSLGIPQIDARP